MNAKVLYTLGELLNKLLPFLLLPYLTRKLGVDDFSFLVVMESYIALYMLFVNFGQDSLVLKSCHRFRETFVASVFANIYKWFALSAFILLCLTLIYSGELSLNMFFVILIALLANIYLVKLVYLQSKQQVKHYLQFQFVNLFVATLCTIIVFEFVEPKVEFRLGSIVIGFLVVFSFMYIVPSTKAPRNNKKFKKTILKYQILAGFPLLIHQGSFFLKSKADKIILADYPDSIAFSNFSLASMISLMIPLICAAIYRAEVPIIYQKLKRKKKRVVNYKINVVMIIGILLAATIAYILPESFYLYIFGDGFEKVRYYLPFNILVYCFYPIYLYVHNVSIYFDLGIKIITSALVSALISVAILISIWKFTFDLRTVNISILLSSVVSIFIMYPQIKEKIKKNDS